MVDIRNVKLQAECLIGNIEAMELEQQANLKARQQLELNISSLVEKNKQNKEALDIATHAIEILRQVSDEAVTQAYRFLEESLNSALERMFQHTTRRIKLHEYTRSNQYPQLEIELTVGNGKKRSLKADSGHGLAQIVSLLSILSLIVLTNSRRILVMDEVISGLSIHNRKIVTDILWQFTEIGFQFIVNEHGYVPKGSKVFHMEMVGDVSGVKQAYIENKGVYLNSDDVAGYGEGYNSKESGRQSQSEVRTSVAEEEEVEREVQDGPSTVDTDRHGENLHSVEYSSNGGVISSGGSAVETAVNTGADSTESSGIISI